MKRRITEVRTHQHDLKHLDTSRRLIAYWEFLARNEPAEPHSADLSDDIPDYPDDATEFQDGFAGFQHEEFLARNETAEAQSADSSDDIRDYPDDAPEFQDGV